MEVKLAFGLRKMVLGQQNFAHVIAVLRFDDRLIYYHVLHGVVVFEC